MWTLIGIDENHYQVIVDGPGSHWQFLAPPEFAEFIVDACNAAEQRSHACMVDGCTYDNKLSPHARELWHHVSPQGHAVMEDVATAVKIDGKYQAVAGHYEWHEDS